MPVITFPKPIETGAAPPVTAAPTLPTLSVEIAESGWLLGTDALGTGTILGYAGWNDLSDRVRSLTIQRGRDHELNRVEAGRLSMRLSNGDGALDPTNHSSVYWPDIRPMIPVRVTARWSTITYDLFKGFIEGWPQRWTRGPAGDAWVEVTATDGFKVFNLARITLERSEELSGARIAAVLDAVGWPAGERALDTGEATVQAVTLTASSPLTHIQDVAASEGGVFFIDAAGVATFYGRYHTLHLEEDDDTWGDAGTEKNYEDLTYTYDESNLWNEVTVTANALEDQTAEDGFSRSTYYPRSLSVSTLLTSEALMLERAESLLAKYSSPELRVTEVSPEPRGQDSQWPRILEKDIHSRVVVRKRPPSGGLIDQPSMIEGIGYEIASRRFETRWRLSSTLPQVGRWELGDTTYSVLGTTTSLVNTIT